MEIKANDVKNLREKTGAGMMDCKKALTEAEGDLAKAEKLLKEWGLAGVAKRAGRATNEGRVFVGESGAKVAIIEIACETDFVARNEDFIAAGGKMAALCAEKKLAADAPELETMVKDIASKIKENITLKRVTVVERAAGENLHTYIHGEGKIGVVVKTKSDSDAAFAKEAVAGFIHDLALHIAAFAPAFLDKGRVSAEYVKEQEEIFRKQVEGDEKMKGKPANVVDGILKGKLQKLMGEICLLDQGFVKDEKQSVAKVMAELSKSSGSPLSIVDYVYFRVGEN